ncbi:polyphosphate--glucose phosphotransferase [uncultured Pseudokineococcus sp.]|uniref:polyphosphate--glucose phosphotransferase n=1 Tax=uncultured Pseudokineococcus sp. TaxID=1642928 RepID=UPI0026303338|nr:ROK family protein [uncultured Pseudokineococcus sp.]
MSAAEPAPATSRGRAVGIDIGGSGIKGAPVDLVSGAFAADRVREPTPQPSTPDAVADVVAALAGRWPDGPLGVTFPAVVKDGVTMTAANVDKAWIGTDAAGLLRERTGRPVHVVNDADAAGVAEARYGAAKDVRGVVVVATLGTGIGTALLHDGVLVPNTELGHLEVDGHDAETRASDAARDREDLSWKDWAKRLQRYFSALEALLQPDLLVIGGGVSKKSEKFLPHLDLRVPVVPAQLLNTAGIVGAAALAAEADLDPGTADATGSPG